MPWWNRLELTQEQIERIRYWVEVEKRTHKWVGEQLGCSNQNVSRICKKHGIETQRTGPRNGPGHPNWKGGRQYDKHGYVYVYCKGHPRARRPRCTMVFEHILVMEKHLGRNLLPGEVVHHKNGIRDDNRIENLEVFESNAEHLRHELSGRVPEWSEDGKVRIQEGIDRAAYINHVRQTRDDLTTP